MTDSPSFPQRIDFDRYFAGLRAAGHNLNDAQCAWMRAHITDRLSNFEGSTLIGGNNPLISFVLRPFYFIAYAVQNIAREGFDLGKIFSGFGDWFKRQTGETAAGGQNGMLVQAMMRIHSDFLNCGDPAIAACANISTGSVRANTNDIQENPEWNIFNQVSRFNRPLTPVQQAVGSSLNGAGDRQRYAVANATTVAPPGPTPSRAATPALTASV